MTHLDRPRCSLYTAKGPAKELFENGLGPKVIACLEESFACIPDDDYITVSLYMVGDSGHTASPAVVLISKSRQARKNARKAITESEIFCKYPEFKVVYVSKHPGTDKIEALASGAMRSFEEDSPKVVPKGIVYYDASKPIQHLGLGIWIGHSTSLRAATANAVRVPVNYICKLRIMLFLKLGLPKADRMVAATTIWS